MWVSIGLLSLCTVLRSIAAQQYAGETINNNLPGVPGSEIAYFKIADKSGKNNNLTLVNYYSHGSNGQRIVESNVRRAVIVVHGLNRDPGTYMSNMLSALSQVPSDPNVNFDSVAILAPYFPNGDDKNTGYPWTDGLSAGRGSTTSALVWQGSQWSAGGNNQYPYLSKTTSSFEVLDQLVLYFDDRTRFPQMKQIVVAGHSLGAQTVQRYAAIGNVLSTNSPVNYWIGNPNSYAWQSTARPLSTASCPTYDNYREGYTNFTSYPMTYGATLVAKGRAAIQANYQAKAINYGRGTQDVGDDSSSCAPFTTGANRNERFFNFIKAFPVSCADPKGRNCDTVDFVNIGHDGGGMFAAPAGQARLFLDNFYGDGNRSYDFGYPRQQAGDDPYPNPALNITSASFNNNTYAGNMTYVGCWSDQSPATLSNNVYSGSALTIESCTQLCAGAGYTIAGLENGYQCFCDNALGYLATQVVESSCTSACSGNSSETCGGSSRLSLFSNGRPAQQAAPSNPETVGNFYYAGCYTEATNGRALSVLSTTSANMSLEYCASFCSRSAYFGTEYGQECYCGNNFNAGSVRASDADCNMLCANAPAEFCGAGNRLTVYKNSNYVVSPSCPTANGTTISSGNKNFLVACGTDYSGGDISNTQVADLQGCLDACAGLAGCVAVASVGTTCYMKSSFGAGVSNSNVAGARLVTQAATISSGSTLTSASPAASTNATTPASSVATSTAAASCPSSDGMAVVSGDHTFQIACGYDYPGGDLTSTQTSSFQGCLDACAQNSQCLAVAYVGPACYLKSAVSKPSANGNVWAAKWSNRPVSTAVACPDADGRTISTAGGRNFTVACGIDYQAGDLSSTQTSTFQGCMDACSSNSQCLAVAYVGNACYLKSTVGAPNTNSNVWGAKASGPAVSASTATTTAAPTSMASASSVTCPQSNGQTLSVAGGRNFTVACGVDYYAGDLTNTQTSSFQGCLDACGQNSQCVAVAYVGPTCYLKSAIGAANANNNVWGAKVSSPVSSISASTPSTSCPQSDGQTLPVAGGRNFTVACGIDYYAGDLSSTQTSTFQGCLDACGQNSQCVAVAYVGPACYLKSSIGVANSNSNVWGAKVSSPTTSASTATSSSTVNPSATCPQSDGQTLSVAGGRNFTVACGTDYYSGDLSATQTSTFQGCLDACGQNSQCVAVSYVAPSCYLKSTLNAPVKNANVMAAKVAISSPATTTTSTISTASAAITSTLVSSSALPSSSIASSAVATSSIVPSSTIMTTSSISPSSTDLPATSSIAPTTSVLATTTTQTISSMTPTTSSATQVATTSIASASDGATSSNSVATTSTSASTSPSVSSISTSTVVPTSSVAITSSTVVATSSDVATSSNRSPTSVVATTSAVDTVVTSSASISTTFSSSTLSTIYTTSFSSSSSTQSMNSTTSATVFVSSSTMMPITSTTPA